MVLQRYSVSENRDGLGFSNGIEPDKGGGFVAYEDYERLRAALKEAGDVIESYHKSTGVDLGDASRMPFYADTMRKIDAALQIESKEDG